MGCLSQHIDSLVEKAKITYKTCSELVKSLEHVRQGIREVAKAVSKTPRALEYRIETRGAKFAKLVVRTSSSIVKLQIPSLLPQLATSGAAWGVAELASRAFRRKKRLEELLAEYYCDASTATLE